MQKRLFSLLTVCALCACMLVLPCLTAGAASGSPEPAAISVSLVDHEGNPVQRIVGTTGSSVWAVFRVTGAPSDVTGANFLLDTGNSAIAPAATPLALSPHSGVDVSVTKSGTVVSVLALGTVSTTALTQAGGELCRVELVCTGTVNADATLRLLERRERVFTGVSVASGTFEPTLGSFDYLIGNGSNPSVTGGTLINGFAAYSGSDLSQYSDWSFYKDSLLFPASLPNNKGRTAQSTHATSSNSYSEPYYNNGSWTLGVDTKEDSAVVSMTTKNTYDLSGGFTLTFRAAGAGNTGNFRFEYQDSMFVKIGDYTCVLKGRVTPQIRFDGHRFGDDAKWTVADLSGFSSYNNGSNAYNETAAKNYNKLDGATKESIETNIKEKWNKAGDSTARVQAVTPEGNNLSYVLFTVTYDATAGTLTFQKDSGSSAVNATGGGSVHLSVTATGINAATLTDAAISFGTECPGATGTLYSFKQPTLTATAATYTASVTDGQAGSWTNGKVIPAAHKYTCVASNGANRLYQCGSCNEYAYEQGTTALDAVPLTDCTVTLAKNAFAYTGQPITPAVTVRFGGNGDLSMFKVNTAYSNNTAVGTASVTVTPNAASSVPLSGSVVLNYAIVRPGDVNGDGEVNMTDYVFLKRNLSNLTDTQRAAAELTGNNTVDNGDLTALWNKLLKKGAN